MIGGVFDVLGGNGGYPCAWGSGSSFHGSGCLILCLFFHLWLD
jgi:hypothetical protein